MGKRKDYVYDKDQQDRYYRSRKRWNKKKDKLTSQVYERDGAVCKDCGTSDDLTIDHIVPLSKDGTNDLNNLQVLCLSCNCTKGIN
ncbi:MAG: HNH endonuclease [Planctomycetota bacterium]|jgi:5-methylcytosine-specific restriction endonuclease McrA